MRRLIFLWGLLGWLLAIAAACQSASPPTSSPTPAPPLKVLRIGVDESAAALPELVEAPFAAFSDAARVVFVPGSGATLLEDVADGRLDAALVYALPPQSLLWTSPVALDGLVMVVHPDNPVSDLSRTQAQGLFNGRITNWQEVGGASGPVRILARPSRTAVRALFDERVLAEQRLDVNARVEPEQAGLVTAVAGDPDAVGYAMQASATGVKPLSLNGIAATPAALTSQNYPLTVPLYFASAAEPQDALRTFLAWLQSDAGQRVIAARYGRVRQP